MTDNRTEELASLYVLDVLTAEEKAEFEALLTESPEARRLVRELRASLFDPEQQPEGPMRMDLLEGIHGRLGLPLTGGPVPDADRARPVLRLPWTYIWASAAVLFLCLNLMLLLMLGDDAYPRGREVATAMVSEREAETPVADAGAEGKLLQARIERLEQHLAEREAELRDRSRSLEELEKENREVTQYNAGWQREYARLAARFLPFFEPNDGMSRFTVIEMVDAEAYAADLPRRGFTELAGKFLSGQESIADADAAGFIGPVVEGAGVFSSRMEVTGPGLEPVPSEMQTTYATDEAKESASGEIDPVYDSESLGFTVWRDDDQKGFLDLYNLPPATEGRKPYLWVRSSELEPYIPVGYLPELEDGTGSFFYSVDEPNFTPTEILITEEADGQAGAAPAGNILLRGP